MAKQSMLESHVKTGNKILRISGESAKRAFQLVFAIPYFMDWAEGRKKKVCSPCEDALLSSIFTFISGGAFLLAVNSKPNLKGGNTPEEYLIASIPLITNTLVNLYRIIERKVKPMKYDQNPRGKYI